MWARKKVWEVADGHTAVYAVPKNAHTVLNYSRYLALLRHLDPPSSALDFIFR